MKPVPIPSQAPQHEGIAKLPDVSLYYWDTGGDGETVVLLHPHTGSANVWSYQQPVFAAAGYRVIAYSRRGFQGSEVGPEGGIGADDLDALMNLLKVDRFHLLGTAYGGFPAVDYALSHPQRLRSLVLACSQLGCQEPEIRAMIAAITPKEFSTYPPDFRELSPSYRAANPEGTQAWLALEHQSGEAKFRQPNRNKVSYAALAGMKVPTLLLTGDADLIAPPPLQHLFLKHLPNAELVVLPECGHSAYWEQPEMFNRDVLAFFAKHKA